MRKKLSKVFLPLLILSFLAGCAAKQTASKKVGPAFTPVDLNSKLTSGKFVKRIDHFAVITDASDTMTEPYKGQPKFKLAKTVICRMNQTIPDVQLTAAMRKFGDEGPFVEATPLIYPVSVYSKADFEEAVKGIKYARGGSPLAAAIDATTEDLASVQGKIAVLIFSDGAFIKSGPVKKAAENMKNKLDDRVCIYTVLVGNDPKGKALLEDVARIGQCGTATTADAIATSDGMAAFVESVFLTQAPVAAAVTAADSDGDGVPDSIDECPNTPTGATVNERGCWSYMHSMLFDFDSAVIKADVVPALDEAVKVLNMHPDLKVEIQGHTDNIGTPEYNQKLSERRANAVRDYLIGAGIAPSRIKTVGFGMTKPVASNDTAAGRAKNRRVEFRRMD